MQYSKQQYAHSSRYIKYYSCTVMMSRDAQSRWFFSPFPLDLHFSSSQFHQKRFLAKNKARGLIALGKKRLYGWLAKKERNFKYRKKGQKRHGDINSLCFTRFFSYAMSCLPNSHSSPFLISPLFFLSNPCMHTGVLWAPLPAALPGGGHGRGLRGHAHGRRVLQPAALLDPPPLAARVVHLEVGLHDHSQVRLKRE